MSFLGIDLGTSSIKCLLTDEHGVRLDIENVEYDFSVPAPGYAEQDPRTWWEAAVSCISALTKRVNAAEIQAIGLSGQMHGTVALDKQDQPVCNAILHCDARSGEEAAQIAQRIGKERFLQITGNPLFPGFPPSSLTWLRRHDPHAFERIHRVMQPKDYLRLRLTGMAGAEVTDAAGATLLDLKTGNWSGELFDVLELNPDWFSPISRSDDVAGTVTRQAALETGLREGTPVVYGAADQAAQALGNGAASPGMMIANIGTGGQIFAAADAPVRNPSGNTHTFVHAPRNTWYLLGATLSAGLSLKWFTRSVLGRKDYAALDGQAAQLVPGSGPIFLPYLTGERTPHLDPDARGVFFGMSLADDTASLYRSVLDGVVFSLRDSLEILSGLGVNSERIIASGGGASSPLWLQIQADVFGREVVTTAEREQAALGAAIMAAVGSGTYPSLEKACAEMVHPGENKAWPKQENVAAYEEKYQRYHRLYPAVRELYREQNQ